MTQTNIASGAGLRHVRIYALGTDGIPTGDESGVTAYDGVRVEGAKSFTSNVPDPRIVTHTGDDRPFASDVLPPTEMESATLTTAKTNLGLDATLNTTKVEAISATLNMGVTGTDKAGSEQQIMIMGWRQALDTEKSSSTFGQRRYITRMYPSARMVPKAASMEDGGADENSYNVVPTSVTETPWGKALSDATNGATEAQSLRMISDYPLMLNRWTGDNSIVEFTLSNTPITAARTKVWSNGVAATVSSVNTSTKTVTVSVAPAYLAAVVALYETSDNLN